MNTTAKDLRHSFIEFTQKRLINFQHVCYCFVIMSNFFICVFVRQHLNISLELTAIKAELLRCSDVRCLLNPAHKPCNLLLAWCYLFCDVLASSLPRKNTLRGRHIRWHFKVDTILWWPLHREWIFIYKMVFLCCVEIEKWSQRFRGGDYGFHLHSDYVENRIKCGKLFVVFTGGVMNY